MVNILIKNPTAEQVAIAERIQAAKQKKKIGSFAVDAKRDLVKQLPPSLVWMLCRSGLRWLLLTKALQMN